MDTNLTIFFIFFLLSITFLFFKFKVTNEDNFIIQQYYDKPKYKKRVVLIIESFLNLKDLLTLLENILMQDIKVDAIMLVSKDKTLNKIKLIKNTCILHKCGGLFFLLKESSHDTILLFLFPPCFKAFLNPKFLKKVLTSKIKSNGLVKVETKSIHININKVYDYYHKIDF